MQRRAAAQLQELLQEAQLMEKWCNKHTLFLSHSFGMDECLTSAGALSGISGSGTPKSGCRSLC